MSTADQPQGDWYIVKQASGQCTIVPSDQPEEGQRWGPFPSESDAIARRIGLIRAGKCKPA